MPRREKHHAVKGGRLQSCVVKLAASGARTGAGGCGRRDVGAHAQLESWKVSPNGGRAHDYEGPDLTRSSVSFCGLPSKERKKERKKANTHNEGWIPLKFFAGVLGVVRTRPRA